MCSSIASCLLVFLVGMVLWPFGPYIINAYILIAMQHRLDGGTQGAEVYIVGCECNSCGTANCIHAH